MSDTPAKEKGDFTPREMEIMAKAWCCMVDEPKVDYAKLAEACGMTNVKSASNAWSGIKKKILAHAGATGDGEAAGTPVKKTPKKRTKKAAGEGDGDDEESPAKKPKASPKKKAKAKSEERVIENEGEGAEGEEDKVKEEGADD